MSKEEQTLYDKLKGPGPDLSGYRKARALEESEQRFLEAFFEKVKKESGCGIRIIKSIVIVIGGGDGYMVYQSTD